MSDPTKFVAIVNKVQTLADNGLRVYLDLPEQAIGAVAELMIYKRAGIVLNVVVEPQQDDCKTEAEQYAVGKGPKRKSEWTTQEGTGANSDS